MYSQAYSLYKSGFACDLTTKEERENEEINHRHYLDNDDIDAIRRFLIKGTELDDFMTSTQIVEYLSEVNSKGKYNSKNIGKALKKAGFMRKQQRTEANSSPFYGYYLKFKNQHQDINNQDFTALKQFLNSLEIGIYQLKNLHTSYNSNHSPKLSVFDIVHFIQNEMMNNEKVPKMELKNNDLILQVFTNF